MKESGRMKGIAGLGWGVLALAIGAGVVLWTGAGATGPILEGQPGPQEQPPLRDGTVTSGVFTPAHRSIGEAIRHFLNLRDDPEQPIAYSHQLHVQEVGLGCEFCHDGVSVSAVAGIPGVETCMLCHSEVGQDLPEVQALVEFHDNGLEPPWERVYGWVEEAHVLFNHRPHYDAGVGCATCHGNVETMGVAELAVDHSMSFCVSCHEESQASIDCLTCHY